MYIFLSTEHYNIPCFHQKNTVYSLEIERKTISKKHHFVHNYFCSMNNYMRQVFCGLYTFLCVLVITTPPITCATSRVQSETHMTASDQARNSPC